MITEPALHALCEAIETDPSRAEAFLAAAVWHYHRQEWAKAVPLLQAATAATRNPYGFNVESNYTHLPWDYLGVCLHQLGRRSEAIAATVRALELGSPDLERLTNNLRMMSEAAA